MENREDLAIRVLLNREYFDEVLRFVVLTKVSFDRDQRVNLENTYHKYVVFQNGENQIFSKRGHGRIGMTPFREFRNDVHNGFGDFEQYVDMVEAEFTRVNVQYFNAKHLALSDPIDSELPNSVNNLLIRLLDEYMPTGILHIDQVLEAEDILRDIRQRLENDVEIDIASSERFYEIVPQNGNPERLEIIDNLRIYRNKIEVLDRLRSALEAIRDGVRIEINPIDYFARYWLRTQFNELNRTREEFQRLQDCIQATQHPNEMQFRLANAFRVSSSADIEFANDMPNQRLLYHFTFPCNILGILREGLQAAPRHIYSRNRFLGDGIYFWDCASIALSAFRDLPEEMTPVLLVCRVALGATQTVEQMFLEPGNILPLPNGMNSFYCEGREFSNVTSASANFGNAEMYCGQVAQLYGSVNFVNYNKYMIQNRHQVKIEYVLQFQRV